VLAQIISNSAPRILSFPDRIERPLKFRSQHLSRAGFLGPPPLDHSRNRQGELHYGRREG
jgi:hypothetical protein